MDVHVTRVFAKAQWNILGFGPYSSLNDKQRSEVVDHICERCVRERSERMLSNAETCEEASACFNNLETRKAYRSRLLPQPGDARARGSRMLHQREDARTSHFPPARLVPLP